MNTVHDCSAVSSSFSKIAFWAHSRATSTLRIASYSDGHGWPYQENNDFTLFTGYGVPQNWVTSEATGHAVRALLSAGQ